MLIVVYSIASCGIGIWFGILPMHAYFVELSKQKNRQIPHNMIQTMKCGNFRFLVVFDHENFVDKG